MFSDPRPEAGSWLLAPFAAAWNAQERPYAALLDALARTKLAAETAEVEMNAKARRSMADVKEEEVRLADEALDDARRQLHAFRDALEDAHHRSAAGGGDEVPYDSADPNQDTRAELLIQYLVRTGYGEVRTEELGPQHYIYYVKVAWDRLRQLAEEEGHPLAL